MTREGELRKAEALALLAAKRERLVRQAQRALLNVLLDSGEATIDQARAMVEVPDGIDPKLFGAAPGPLARAGIIYAAGYVKTKRAEAHARPVTLWRLADKDAAIPWLATHPELPEPSAGNDDADGLDARQQFQFEAGGPAEAAAGAAQ